MNDWIAITVAGDGRRDLALDVFHPAGGANGAAVILLHGGGWARGHRSATHGYARVLASAGFVAIAAEYRLLGEAAFPAQVDDIRDAVRWVRAHAEELRVDPDMIALQGYSAGGHLALMVAGTQPGSGHEGKVGGTSDGSGVAAVVAFFAAARLDGDAEAIDMPPLAALLNGGGMDAARAASPVHYVNAASPTTFIIGGTADFMQPLDAGLDLLRAYVAAGAKVEFHYLHSQTHEFCSTPSVLPAIMDEVIFFYRRTLTERRAFEDEARALNPFARVSSFAELMAELSPG